MATSPPSGTSGDEVGRRTFSTSFRGFDQGEVRAYLEVVAAEFAGLQARIAELEAELAQAARAPASPTLDAATLTGLVGEETARVLRAAQEAAEDLRTRAEEGAARTLTEAHEEAARIRSASESVLAERTAEAEKTAADVRAEAQEAAEKLTRDARAEADRTIHDAVEQGRDMLGQAQGARERVLADLARRRRSALAQVEQLRIGRERLVASLANVRTELDRITQDLAAADEVARQAADAAARSADRKEQPAFETVLEPASPEPPTPERAPEPLPAVIETEVALPEPAPVVVVDPEDVTADALMAEEALISAPRKVTKRPQDPIPAPPATRPSYAHDPVPAAVRPGAAVGGDAPAGPGEPPRKVDDLFARIRATAPEPPKAEPAKPEPKAARSGKRKRASAHHPATPAPAPDGPADAGLEAPRSDADETYLQRRDVLVEVVQSGTVRSLRRALADDQNAALDRFRTLKGDTVSVDALLGDEAGQLSAWTERSTPGLRDGAAAGAHLATGGAASPPDAALVAPIAARLAGELVATLRARLERVVEPIGKDRGPDTVDRINSVFREWRSRIDRATGDAVTEAVSAGFTASVAAGTPVAWVVEDLDGPCPDCDDNALAGSISLGEPFPTGQVAPPAHPGCRCVLSRATT
ncbi:MAG: hypothetical protein NVSMB12_07750 [Acidimicrobiales bacterium]